MGDIRKIHRCPGTPRSDLTQTGAPCSVWVRQGLKKMGGCPLSGPNGEGAAPPPPLAEVSFPGGQPPPAPDPAGGRLPAIFLD